LARAGLAEVVGGGPEDPFADIAAAAVFVGTIILTSDTPQPQVPATNRDADDIDKHMEWLAYKWQCDFQPPPPPNATQCEKWKWKRDQLPACIARRQAWLHKWDPSNKKHVPQLERELQNLDRKIERFCKQEKPCP